MPSAYPTELKTVGDHIRKRRLDLSLHQKYVAERIGVDTTTVYNWENNRAVPSLRAVPKIIDFLGYDPLPPDRTSGEKLRRTWLSQGLFISEAAKAMRVDPGTLAAWEQGKRRPGARYLRIVEKFLSEEYN